MNRRGNDSLHRWVVPLCLDRRPERWAEAIEGGTPKERHFRRSRARLGVAWPAGLFPSLLFSFPDVLLMEREDMKSVAASVSAKPRQGRERGKPYSFVPHTMSAVLRRSYRAQYRGAPLADPYFGVPISGIHGLRRQATRGTSPPLRRAPIREEQSSVILSGDSPLGVIEYHHLSRGGLPREGSSIILLYTWFVFFCACAFQYFVEVGNQSPSRTGLCSL